MQIGIIVSLVSGIFGVAAYMRKKGRVNRFEKAMINVSFYLFTGTHAFGAYYFNGWFEAILFLCCIAAFFALETRKTRRKKGKGADGA